MERQDLAGRSQDFAAHRFDRSSRGDSTTKHFRVACRFFDQAVASWNREPWQSTPRGEGLATRARSRQVCRPARVDRAVFQKIRLWPVGGVTLSTGRRIVATRIILIICE